MLVVFANNQLIMDYDQAISVIYTDPVPIGDNNQATGTTTVHRIFNYASGYGLQWTMQVSNDGVNYISQGPAALPIETTGTSLQDPMKVSAVYARLMIAFKASASAVGGVLLDIHVNFDRT